MGGKIAFPGYVLGLKQIVGQRDQECSLHMDTGQGPVMGHTLKIYIYIYF